MKYLNLFENMTFYILLLGLCIFPYLLSNNAHTLFCGILLVLGEKRVILENFTSFYSIIKPHWIMNNMNFNYNIIYE